MNEHFLSLVNENFYSTPEAMRNFFMLGAKHLTEPDSSLESIDIISDYGMTHNTINITGMMVRDESWITRYGFGTSTKQVIGAISDTLAAGKKVKLHVNTGGGQVSGTSNLANYIFENRDNVEAYSTGVVASAGMWIFAMAGTRYAEDTTVMGSIGVVTSVMDDKEFWKSHGIVMKEIVSENAKNKRPDIKTEDGEREVKRYLTSLESVFLESISLGLNMSKDDIIKNFNEGGLITGKEAFELNVIDGLTSHNMVATMPSTSITDEKIENSNDGGNQMITQEEFDAVQSQIKDLEASTAGLLSERDTLSAQVAVFEQSIVAKSVDVKEIVAMAFEHNADKALTMKMLDSTSKADAGLVLLAGVKSQQATVESNDLGESDQPNADAEKAYIEALAKKLSV